MEFEKLQADGVTAEYHSSEGEAEVNLLFVNGPLNPGLWEQQLEYFSNRFTATTYRSPGGYENELKVVERILEEGENTVIISYGPGNCISQYFEDRKDVIATVLTNPGRGVSIPRRTYSAAVKAFKRKPKLASKLFFHGSAQYSTVREFSDKVEPAPHDELRTYTRGFSLREPIKDSLFVCTDSDRFSSMEFAEEIRSEADLGVIENAGTFPFFEKPQEFNKAVFDFLLKVEEFAESKNVRERKTRNRTLEGSFEDSSLEKFAKKVESH